MPDTNIIPVWGRYFSREQLGFFELTLLFRVYIGFFISTISLQSLLLL
jgi:hypothetical protein